MLGYHCACQGGARLYIIRIASAGFGVEKLGVEQTINMLRHPIWTPAQRGSGSGVERMKHLLSGAAAAVLAVTFALGWTTSSAANQQAAVSTPDASTTSAAPPSHRHPHSHSHGAEHRTAAGKTRARSARSDSANLLNQQELSRLQSGGSMPPPEPAPAPARGTQLQGPRPSSGR
jgi:hypothetical protein